MKKVRVHGTVFKVRFFQIKKIMNFIDEAKNQKRSTTTGKMFNILFLLLFSLNSIKSILCFGSNSYFQLFSILIILCQFHLQFDPIVLSSY